MKKQVRIYRDELVSSPFEPREHVLQKLRAAGWNESVALVDDMNVNEGYVVYSFDDGRPDPLPPSSDGWPGPSTRSAADWILGGMIVLAVFVLIWILVSLSGCGADPARANSTNPNMIRLETAPDGSRCYLIFNASGDVAGGNCR